MYSALVANEVVDEAKRLKKKCLIFKVDYERTYDSVCWEFVIYMLQSLGFDAKWIKWIERVFGE